MKKLLAVCAALLPLAACAPTPDQPEVSHKLWLEQGWKAKERSWYHHASQGTATFPISFEWFMELNQPIAKDQWFKDVMGDGTRLADSRYMEKFGFISDPISEWNPYGLPVGVAVDLDHTDPNTGRTTNAIGLTCAACHTGQFTYKGTNVRVDGGPATLNLTDFGQALILALIETDALETRRSKFKKGVITRQMQNSPDANQAELEKVFDAEFKALTGIAKGQVELMIKFKGKNVEEGFTRLDALNRIGNTVFGPLNMEKNYVATDAPVNYPHIWSTSWFDWVQYDGSIMQPTIRNAGEAMGVAAALKLTPGKDQFASTVRFNNLQQMEDMLAGHMAPMKSNSFNGLKAPSWPEELLGPIDQAKAAKGEKLYNKMCVQCHAPSTKTTEFWSDKYWKKMPTFLEAPKTTKEKYYEVKVVDLNIIGTDPAQASILPNRKVDLSKMGSGVDSEVCLIANGKMVKSPVKGADDQLFATSLGTTVQKVTDYFDAHNGISTNARMVMNDYRPNCLQAPHGYKARPLNGIWSTGPFLHNGSVPNLYSLLSPVVDRPETIYLGYLEFDPKKVGFISTREDGLSQTHHLTKVKVAGADAKIGNLNTGHEFNDNKGPGVIGRLLTEEERWQIVEFLKTQ